jgi:hypothetical protein
MKNVKSQLVMLLILVLGFSMSCKVAGGNASKPVSDTSKIDFSKPAKGLDVKVELDKKQAATELIGKQGGSVSLAAADGSKFKLEVPPDALDSEMPITITAVKTLDGAPLESNTPAAVQLEPSGLTFKDFVTLTVVPGEEIPLDKQVAFGYEGNGKDYHLAPVDPKSKEIRIKLLGFSGAGVGTTSDTGWAAHQMIEASSASARLLNILAQQTRAERHELLLGNENGATTEEIFRPFLDAFMDQVVMKEIAAAELDCKHAQKALHDLIFHERLTQLTGLADSATGSPGFSERSSRLLEIGHKCQRAYRVNGSSNNVSFTGEICSISKPFSIDATFPGGKAKTTFFPDGGLEGQTTVYGGGGGCQHSGGGDYTAVLTDDGAGTLTWTTTDTITCPRFGNTRTATFSLPLTPAPELSCP